MVHNEGPDRACRSEGVILGCLGFRTPAGLSSPRPEGAPVRLRKSMVCCYAHVPARTRSSSNATGGLSEGRSMKMNWPTSEDYLSAFQRPSAMFVAPELKTGKVQTRK